MKKQLLSLGILAIGFTVSAQNTQETKIADIKNTRITTYWEDTEMTIPVTSLDDQTLTKYFYDKNGNLVLTSEYNFAGYYYHTSYRYNVNNLLESDSTDNVKNFYFYNSDGTLQKKTKQKVTTGETQETTLYEYENGKLTYEIIYNNKDEEKGKYRYTYEGDLLIKSEYITGMTTGSNPREKISNRIEYTYDAVGNKTDEINYKLSTTSSSLGTIRSATRYQYSYDAQNRMIESVYAEATATSGTLGSWTNKKKSTYTYTDDSTIPSKKENYMWDPTNLVFAVNDYDTYNTSVYSKDRMPQNLKVEQGESVTTVNLTFDAPVDSEGIKGYGLIINNKLHEEVYPESPIVLNKQVKGTHTYRVMALYDTIAGNVTDEIGHIIDINLPAPSNGRVLTKELSSQWVVTFAYDAPDVPQGTTLTGYRYVVTGGNGNASGTITPADMTKGTFKLYHNYADNEKNLVTLSLYAVYEEGESEPYEFQIDLRDTTDQIIAHWLNQSSERYVVYPTYGAEELVSTTNYYYTSVNTSNTETLVATVENRWSEELYKFMPALRTVDGVTEKYNETTKQWENYRVVESVKDGSETDYLLVETSKIYNVETDNFEVESIRKDHYYYDESTTPWTLLNDWSKYYTVENGVEKYEKYVVHSAEGNTAVETVYASDEQTLTGKVEHVRNAFGRVVSEKNYNYVGGEFKLVSYVQNEYDADSDLLNTTTYYNVTDNVETVAEVVRYTGSKEYHYTKMPFSLSYKNGVLSWQKPSTESVNPTGYRVFANNIPYGDTSETSMEIADLPTGKYSINVMCLFGDSESSLSDAISINHVSLATFEPTNVSPEPYADEKDNTIENLSSVTLTFPSKIASLSEGVSAMLQSRFMGYEVESSISEDGMSIVFSMPENLDNGLYTLEVPMKMINSEEGTYNPTLAYRFQLIAPLTTDLPSPTPDPAEGYVAELKEVTLKFDRDVYALESAIGVSGVAYAEDDKGVKYDAVIDIEGYDYTLWTVIFSESIKAAGKYTLVIPEATFGDATASSSAWTGSFTTGKVNPKLTFKYEVKDLSVGVIESDNTIRVEGNNILLPVGAKVYNASGYEVNPMSLDSGVYIVVLKDGEATKVRVK